MGEEWYARRLVKGVDTNLLARFVMRDDPEQADKAESVLRDGAFVSLTVFLELSWLLGSRYRLDRREIAHALDAILELPSVEVAEREGIGWAVDRFRKGADLADMVHLVAAGSRPAFVTFDRNLAKAAGRDTPVSVETLT